MERVIGFHVSRSASAVRGSRKQHPLVCRQTAFHTQTHKRVKPVCESDREEPSSIMTAGGSMESSTTAARPKNPVQPTLSGPMLPSKKSPLEVSLSGGSTAAATSTNPKASYGKNLILNNSAPESQDSSKPKAIASRFENAIANEDSKPPFAKPLKMKPPDSNQNSEPKPKLPLQKSQVTEAKTTLPKPPPVTSKPFKSTKTEINETSTNATPTPPKIPATPKPKSTINNLRHQQEEDKEKDQIAKPFSRLNPNQSSFRAAQNVFSKVEDAAKDESKNESSKESQAAGPVVPTIKPSYKTKPSGPFGQTAKDDSSGPKRNPLTNILALGGAPSKPNRPPRVNLEKFKKGEPPSEGPEIKKGGPLPPPPPPASHPSSHAAPTLPPRPPGPIALKAVIPSAHFDVAGNTGRQDEGSGSDGETYEELDGWSSAEVKEQEKKREKEEKKRAEQEKRDQKEREKKEQEARKKFKLIGPLKVIHKVKARTDCKGSRTDLCFKQGDFIDILRITDNPEGRWLGRTQDGSCGYVKTESVQIDFDSLKNQTKALSENDGDVYDDVGSQEDNIILPPPPEGPDDIYDDLEDPSLNVKYPPPPPQFSPEDNPGNDEVYDDVDRPQPPSSMPPSKPKLPRPEVKLEDPKKQKKFEKEEKDFRKKFKFEGEIQVLYQVTVIANKKGSGKDLTVQIGDTLDVISNSDNDKLICRNKEGKFGYVLHSIIQTGDNDIYDDIGDGMF
ncbi:FYN-binding protein 1 [Bagarius yarrelli]|uniref:FYN-binding protein 1 n=1 Tax=Bagarius yarrelli TaxID=175774 RepID=A0A556V6Z0_BAGYA|nr:FYN-binding protein 1 [Bagarius yarrelli]